MYNYINHDAFMIKNEKNDDAISQIKKNLFTPDVGFTNGTIFRTLYEPYKNYQPVKPTSLNEKDRALLAVQMYGAALHDMNLYLDVYPDDKEALKIRKEYYEKYKHAKDEYEDKYSPYCLYSDFSTTKSFGFSTENFPWNRRGEMNV